MAAIFAMLVDEAALGELVPLVHDELHVLNVAVAPEARRRGVARALAAVSDAAAGTGHLMPQIIDAVRARGTLGEISDALRAAWGVYRPA